MRRPTLALAMLFLSASALATPALAQSSPALAKVRGYIFTPLPDGREGIAYTVDTYAVGHRGPDGNMVADQPPQSLRIVQPAGKSRPFNAGANVWVRQLADGEARVSRVIEPNEFQGGTGFYSVIGPAPLMQEHRPGQ